MSGMIITGIGIGMVILAVVLTIASATYRKTAGRKIQEELKREYD